MFLDKPSSRQTGATAATQEDSASTALPWFWLATRLPLGFFNFLHHLNQAWWDLGGCLLPAVMPAWEVSLHPFVFSLAPEGGDGHQSPLDARLWHDGHPRAPQGPPIPHSNTSHRWAVSWTGCKRCSGGSLGRRVWRTGRKHYPFIFLLLC